MSIFFVIVVFCTVGVIKGQSSNFPDCKMGPLASFPICDPSVPARERVIDLVNRMTIPEKTGRLGNVAYPVDHLGLPRYQWWSEALHGLMYWNLEADLPGATSFPIPLNLAATFNMDLINSIGGIISTEARAANNQNQVGLNFFTPNINIVRDPRWGRGQETPGEDPFLTSEYAYAMVRGLQEGEDKRYLKVAANCKHYIAYDLENSDGVNRFHFNAKVSDQDLVETYLPPFEKCILDAHGASTMCSFNSVNDIPVCAHQFLLQTIARETFHLDGVVVSDCGGVQNIMTGHNYTSTPQQTVAAALHAGVDVDCGNFYAQNAQSALINKTIVESDIDLALERAFGVLLRLGYFDAPEEQPYRNLSISNIDTVEARQLALQSSQQSLVLLKNVNYSLPLNVDQLINKKIALIGPSINATVLMQGNYHGRPPFLIDPITAFKAITTGKSINVEYAFGCNIDGNNDSDFAEAIALARSSDIVFFIGGIDLSIEREDLDRGSIALPDIQLSLLQQLEKVVHSPLHVIIMSGSSLDLSYIRDSPQYGSLIWAGYPGQSGGSAIASVVFGQYNPGGRLPITFYPASYVNQVNMTDMSMRPSNNNPGRTYKFYTGQPVFQFGFGLSYTTFSYVWYNDTTNILYSIQSLIKTNPNRLNFHMQSFRVNVTNTGTMDGDDVVLAYVTPPQLLRDGQTPPIKQLFAFQRIHLTLNETKQLFFPFDIQTLFTIAQDGSKWLHPGQYHILIGNQRMFTIQLHGHSALWKRFK